MLVQQKTPPTGVVQMQTLPPGGHEMLICAEAGCAPTNPPTHTRAPKTAASNVLLMIIALTFILLTSREPVN
jgi:hypothetical protein